MRPRPLSYTFLLSFLTAVFLLQWNQQAAYPQNVWQLLALLWMLGTLSLCGSRTKNIGAMAVAVAVGLGFAFGAVARTTHAPAEPDIDTYATGQRVEIRGRVAAEPDRRPLQTKYTVEAEEITTASGAIVFPVRGKVLATHMGSWPRFSYGDEVIIAGMLEKPGRIETFLYDRYLSRYGIYAVMYRASVEMPPACHGPCHSEHSRRTNRDTWIGTFKPILFTVKERFESQINRMYAEPHASFMAGLLTGSRRGIPEDLLKDFNGTGLTHIVAISGYNITIVTAVISSLLFWLPLKKRFIPAVAAIAAFTLFVGAGAAVVRASIMGILGLLALQTGRQSETRLTALWTLFFMLLWNPKYLWYDAGFQLSFLAVFGLVEIAPVLDPLFRHIPRTLGIREALQMTIAAQISAVPFILFLFGKLPLLSPVANVLVAPFIPLAMLFGFLGTVFSFVWFPLGQLVAYPGWGCLEWIVTVAHRLAELPFASVELGRIGGIAVAGYYVVLFVVLWKFRSLNRPHPLTPSPPLPYNTATW